MRVAEPTGHQQLALVAHSCARYRVDRTATGGQRGRMTRKNGVEGLGGSAGGIHRTIGVMVGSLLLIGGSGELPAASKAGLPPQITGFITNKEI
jgi:hypothetical protein